VRRRKGLTAATCAIANMWALVTGASKGIGAACARRLARDGFDVIVHYHSDRKGAELTAAAVKKAKRKAILVQGDLANARDVHAVTVAVQDNAKRDLAVVVHNAGMYDRRKFSEMGGTKWQATRAIDLDAPALLTFQVLPHLSLGASVIFMSSIVAMRGSAHGAHYGAAKAGLLGLARSLAVELAPRVRVNAVCPGYIDTAMIGPEPAAKRREREAEVPLNRVGRPEEVAAVVSFLAGKDSSYMTGATLHVNGGLWIG
jgi:3-oxoacyl-[acyl-carrier protein] reductase